MADGLINRRQRRAAQSQLQDAVKRQRRALALKPNDAQRHNELACALLQQGQSEEAAAHFARSVTLMPELLEQYPHLVAALLNVNPALRAGMARMAAAWPRELPADEILGPDGAAAIFRDPLLRCMLTSATVRHLTLERYLTSVRRIMLDIAVRSAVGDRVEESMLGFFCALAKQCFINEYVFAAGPQETETASRLRDTLVEALAAGQVVAPLVPAAVAAYFPLFRLPGSELLAGRDWPAPVSSLLAQQVVEPAEEQRLRGEIPRLTRIDNDVSVLVKQQYEENPYPRWVALPSDRGVMGVNGYLRQQFPTASFPETANAAKADILVAGCGTGQQSIVTARRFAGASVLAVDLSLASLCYAKRMSRVLGVHNVEYAQADVLELAALARTFDVIEASGVLHHLADPIKGWRVLLSLLRPGGFMHVGLYSKAARGQIRAARAFIAERGVGSSPSDIRRCRQELLSTPMKSVADYADYFSISECRDLLFHVQEHQLTIPEIDAFLREHDLRFIGFELPPQTAASYRFRFPEDRPMANLATWHVFETENPLTFASMYQFWIQKS